jgi:hypothetical protein
MELFATSNLKLHMCVPSLQLNLKFAKLDIELFYEVLEKISAIVHQFHCYFLKKYFCNVLAWIFKIFEQENENFFLGSGNFNQVHLVTDFVKVSVQDGSFQFDSEFIKTNVKRGWSPPCNDIDRLEIRILLGLYL